MVHRAVEPVDAAALTVGSEVGEHRVARRAANPLAETIGEADGEHVAPCAGDAISGRTADEIA